jgi:hypothetical protein
MDQAPPPAANSTPLTSAQKREQIRTEVRNAVNKAINGTSDNAPAIAGSRGPQFDASNIIPPQAVEMMNAFCITLAFIVVGWPLARAFARRMDKRSEIMQAPHAPSLEPQMRQLQDSVDAMAIELERISEGQRYAAKLLSERNG